MRKTLSIISILVVSITACKKNPILSAPKAGFTINGDSSQVYSTATYDGFSLINNSLDADTYLWDLGNGTTTQEKEPSLSYSKSGTYIITLTAINKDGNKSMVSKSIVVKDRVLKEIVIPSINFKSALAFFNSTYPSNKANVWVEIQEAEPGRWDYPPLSSGTYDVPVVYKSPVVLDVDQNSVPIVLNVTQKLIIDFQILVGTQPAGRGYSFNLYAQDATGTYLLTSSYASGVSNSCYGDERKNEFTVTTGFDGSNIVLNCDFE